MARTIEIFVGRELPAWSLFWLDDLGAAVDLSSGWTFAVTIRQGGTDTSLSGATVTANATPTTDSRSASDIPSLTVAPAAASLDTLVTGKATIIVVATSSTKDREGQWPAVVNT
jgi:hypothetical protein